jgi:uncharacterized protein YPO0396
LGDVGCADCVCVACARLKEEVVKLTEQMAEVEEDRMRAAEEFKGLKPELDSLRAEKRNLQMASASPVCPTLGPALTASSTVNRRYNGSRQKSET